MNNIDKYIDFKFFNKPSPFAEKQLIISDGMGYEKNPFFLIKRNYFNNNLIMFVIKGILVIEQDFNKYKLTKNQGILMDLRKKHKYFFDKSFETHIIWFHFRGKPCDSYLEKLSDSNKMPLVFTAPWLGNKIYDVFEIAKTHIVTKEFKISSKIYEILLELTQKSILEIHAANNIHNDFITKVDNFLLSNLNKKSSLDEVAEQFDMSKYYFCRQFKEIFDTTLFSYIKIKKIEVAKSMLLCTNDSISEISIKLGFYDQGYFSNVFKSVTGCTPKKFRTRSCLAETED